MVRKLTEQVLEALALKKQRRQIGSNLLVLSLPHDIQVVYLHNSEILRLAPQVGGGYSITFNLCGFNSPTTKRNINEIIKYYIPDFSLYTKNGITYYKMGQYLVPNQIEINQPYVILT